MPYSNIRAGICAVVDCTNVTDLFEKRTDDPHITNASVAALTPIQYERVRRWYAAAGDYAFLDRAGIKLR